MAAATHVRRASEKEYDQIARVLHDAFLTRREHRYFAGATPDNPGTPLVGKKQMTTRLRFYLSNVWATHLLGGKIRVYTDESDAVIVGATLWLPPHKRISSMITILRAGFGRAFLDWGWRGYKRIVIDWEDVVHKETMKLMTEKEESEMWVLHMCVVDPAYEGKGIGTLLVKDGDSFISAKTMLYCSTDRSRDLYARNGYSLEGKWPILVGLADEHGWPVTKNTRGDQLPANKVTSIMIKQAPQDHVKEETSEF